ncbi:putative HTH-type transcriptional regulator YtcD [compost metagenome]
MSVHDAMYILNGRWKISIIASLCFKTLRFTDLLREVEGISGKMLSRELKNLEENQLVNRTVLKTQPITVEYELTEYGHTLKEVIESLAKWGYNHRKRITGKQ